MDFLVENSPIFSLDIGMLGFSCQSLTCESFNSSCRVKCAGISCGGVSCKTLFIPEQ
jgi:hypothetical protein